MRHSTQRRGWADPQNRNSLTKSEPLVPGEFVDVAFDLQPDDQVLEAGKQLALMVFASDRDFTLWPPPGTELTVDLDATTLVLPVVGGEAALRAA
ncbi:MAG: Xaa-Pro dipeptidyl-peptidase, partial [Planctomycetaceae bacterium]|nr:Xaa-Pro dipeptidyl-peptidase [Planctomycetaceae bacterium]